MFTWCTAQDRLLCMLHIWSFFPVRFSDVSKGRESFGVCITKRRRRRVRKKEGGEGKGKVEGKKKRNRKKKRKEEERKRKKKEEKKKEKITLGAASQTLLIVLWNTFCCVHSSWFSPFWGLMGHSGL